MTNVHSRWTRRVSNASPADMGPRVRRDEKIKV
jgi:hypothetical protein